jgi:DNA-binding phage protein
MGIKGGVRKQLMVKIDKVEVNQVFSNEEEKFIKNLIHERKKIGIIQEDLAEMTGLSQAAIARLESMKSNPTLKTINKILNALDMKLIIVDKE